MNCPNCGNKIDLNSIFCSNCGKKIKNSSAEPRVIDGTVHKKTLKDSDLEDRKKIYEITDDFRVNSDIISANPGIQNNGSHIEKAYLEDELIVKSAIKDDSIDNQDLHSIADTLGLNKDVISRNDKIINSKAPIQSKRPKKWFKWVIGSAIAFIVIVTLSIYVYNQKVNSIVSQNEFPKARYVTSVNRINRLITIKAKNKTETEKLKTETLNSVVKYGANTHISAENKVEKLSKELNKTLYGSWSVIIKAADGEKMWEYRDGKEIKRYQATKEFKITLQRYEHHQKELKTERALVAAKAEEERIAKANSANKKLENAKNSNSSNNATNNNSSNNANNNNATTEYYYYYDTDDGNSDYYYDTADGNYYYYDSEY